MLGRAIGVRLLPLPGSDRTREGPLLLLPGPGATPRMDGPLCASHRAPTVGSAGGPSPGTAAVLSLSLPVWGPSKTTGPCRRRRPSGGLWIYPAGPLVVQAVVEPPGPGLSEGQGKSVEKGLMEPLRWSVSGCAGRSRGAEAGPGRQWPRGGRSRTGSAVRSAPPVSVGGGGCMGAAGKELHGAVSFLALAVSGD